MPFWASISMLGLVQAALVALPAPRAGPAWVERLSSPWWALVPALSIVFAIAAIELNADSATWLSYLALVAVPPLAAFALAKLIHVPSSLTSPFFASSANKGEVNGWFSALLPTAVCFALAWASPGSLAGEGSAAALSGLACITLGWLLVSAVPAYWLQLGVYAMAVIDTIYVSADLLQGPNAVLNAAAPAAGLPHLQTVHFGSAAMGFGDLFVAALVGCILAADGSQTDDMDRFAARRQGVAAGLVAVLALGFDLLFFVVDELPATVPVAVASALTWRLFDGGPQRSAP